MSFCAIANAQSRSPFLSFAGMVLKFTTVNSTLSCEPKMRSVSSWASSTSKPLKLPSPSMVPKAGMSLRTPMRTTPRSRMVSISAESMGSGLGRRARNKMSAAISRRTPMARKICRRVMECNMLVILRKLIRMKSSVWVIFQGRISQRSGR